MHPRKHTRIHAHADAQKLRRLYTMYYNVPTVCENTKLHQNYQRNNITKC